MKREFARVWTIKTRIAFFALTAVAIGAFGTFGYYLIKTYLEEGSPSIVDAVYWTVVTITTLGAYPKNIALTSALGEIFTVAIVLAGIFLIFIGVPFTATPWLEEKMIRLLRPKKAPLPHEGHVLLYNYSDVGKAAADELKMHDVPFVVIENEASRRDILERKGIPYVFGNPTEDTVLNEAHIDGAIALILAADDSTNAFVALAAAKLNPKIRIVANVQDPKHENVLRKAGATKVISSKAVAGLLLAKRALGSYDLEMLGGGEVLPGLEIRQYPVGEKSPLKGRTLRSTQLGKETGATVIGIWKNGEMEVNPAPNYVLDAGTILVVIGKKEQLENVHSLVYGGVKG